MIKVNEIFGPTIQGEGKSAGEKVMFLRTTNCNLHCFKCDTPYTWFFYQARGSHVDGVRFDPNKEIHEMSLRLIIRKLECSDCRRLVISGGEPFLQQKQLTPLVTLLKRRGWVIEVETNGTIPPRPEFVKHIDQINCSPKLEGDFSREEEEVRIRPRALQELAALNKTNFKFVISDYENIDEIVELKRTYGMTDIWLMPEGRFKDQIFEKKVWVEVLCKETGFNFSTRLHVEMFGNERGV